MMKFEGHALFSSLAFLSQWDDVAQNNPDWAYDNERSITVMIYKLDIMIEQFKVLDLRLSIRKAESIKFALSHRKSGSSHAMSRIFSSSLKELKERIEQELEDRSLFYVDEESMKYINEGEFLFGNDVINKFKNAVPDLSEAAKCLGMGRNTGCVFHLMRSMESAVHEMGCSLGVTTEDKSNKVLPWGILIANLDKKVAEFKDQNTRENWAAVAALLVHVKDCWRNPTMHPRQTYTHDEAREVFFAVRTFMKRLARELQ